MAGVEGPMAESLGDLVDRLSIVNVKLFMVQEKVNEAAKAGVGLDSNSTYRLVTLNLQRNDLMTRIDRVLAVAVSTGTTVVDARIKLT